MGKTPARWKVRKRQAAQSDRRQPGDSPPRRRRDRCIRPIRAGDEVEERRLAGAVRTDDPGDGRAGTPGDCSTASTPPKRRWTALGAQDGLATVTRAARKPAGSGWTPTRPRREYRRAAPGGCHPASATGPAAQHADADPLEGLDKADVTDGRKEPRRLAKSDRDNAIPSATPRLFPAPPRMSPVK